MNSLISYELKKIFNRKMTIIFAIATIALSITIFFARAYDRNTFNRLERLKQSCEVLTGEITPEKIKPIKDYHEEFINNPDNFVETDEGRMIKPELYDDFELLEHVLALNNLNTLKKSEADRLKEELKTLDLSENDKLLIKDYIDRLEAKGNLIIDYNLFYDFSDYFLSTMAPVILAFLIIFFLAPVFSNEYNTNMDALILSSKYGKKKIVLSKFIASLIAITAMFILVIVPYNIVNGVAFGLEGGYTSFETVLYNPFTYIMSPYEFTMIEYFCISLGISYLGCIGLGACTLFISSKTRNQLLATMITMAIFFIPLFIMNVLQIEGIMNFAYFNIIRVQSLFNNFEGWTMFGQVFLIKDIVLVGLAIVTISLGFFTYKTFKNHQVEN